MNTKLDAETNIVNITDAFLKERAPDPRTGKPAALPEGADRVRFWDASLTGFGVVVGARSATFIARYRVDGQRRDVTIGRWGRPGAGDATEGATWTVARARREALRLLGAKPRAPSSAPASAPAATLRAALEYHLGKTERGENRRGKVCSPRSIVTMRDEVNRHLAAWLDRPLVALDADALEKITREIEATTPRRSDANPANPPGRAMANRLMRHVSAIWTSWDKRHGLPGASPTRRLTAGALAPRDTRIPDGGFAAWHARVMAMPNGVRRDLQLVALFTGVRSEGLRTLTWNEIDFGAELIQIARAKGDRPYTIPMVATVRAILERRQRENAAEFDRLGGDHGFVFPSVTRARPFRVIAVAEPKELEYVRDGAGHVQRDDDGNPQRRKAIELLGIHASRRTFNSVALEIGVPAEAREALMNHAGRGVNVRAYGRPQNWNHLRSCADQIEAALLERINGRPVPRRRQAARGLMRVA